MQTAAFPTQDAAFSGVGGGCGGITRNIYIVLLFSDSSQIDEL